MCNAFLAMPLSAFCMSPALPFTLLFAWRFLLPGGTEEDQAGDKDRVADEGSDIVFTIVDKKWTLFVQNYCNTQLL